MRGLDQSQLAEQLAGVDERQHRLLAILGVVKDFHPSRRQDEDAIAQVRGNVDQSAPLEFAGFGARLEPPHLLLRETLEERTVLQVPELLVHSGETPPWCAERLCRCFQPERRT